MQDKSVLLTRRLTSSNLVLSITNSDNKTRIILSEGDGSPFPPQQFPFCARPTAALFMASSVQANYKCLFRNNNARNDDKSMKEKHNNRAMGARERRRKEEWTQAGAGVRGGRKKEQQKLARLKANGNKSLLAVIEGICFCLPIHNFALCFSVFRRHKSAMFYSRSRVSSGDNGAEGWEGGTDFGEHMSRERGPQSTTKGLDCVNQGGILSPSTPFFSALASFEWECRKADAKNVAPKSVSLKAFKF